MHTPLRDELHLNDERSVSAEESRQEEKQRQHAIRKQVQEGLFKLPAPKNEYQIVVPSAAKDEDEDEEKATQVPDASDLAAEEAAKARAAQAELLRERTTVLRRALPRPLTVESSLLAVARADLADADALVRREMHAIILQDAVHFPVGKAPKLPAGASFERFTTEQLGAAEALVKAELATMTLPSLAEVADAWEAVTARVLPTPGTGALVTSADKNEVRVEALRKQFETVKMHVTREGKKAAKLEQKIALLHGGYERVAVSTAKDVQDAAARVAEIETELACFRKLRAHEVLVAPARVGALKEEVEALKQREGELQNRYAALHSDLQTRV
jgi:pre-mRNA-splicing factor CDC5/CEF1